MRENIAFMIATAMGLAMYNHLVKLFTSRVDFVEPMLRLEPLRFNAINVFAEWLRGILVIHD